MRIGVLGSGRGTNFEAILRSIKRGELDAEIAAVISDIEDAPILEKARKEGLAAFYLAPGKHRTFLDPLAEETYVRTLQGHGVEWVALAGFMRVLKRHFFEAYQGRIVNIHPSLLPAFPGLEAWRQALEWGAKVTGVTVHLVDEGVDTGPIILQEAVAIREDDTPETLHQRVQEVEHRLYPQALQCMVEGRLELKGRRVVIKKT